MTDFWIVAAWAALACSVVAIGRLLGSSRILGTGALMMLFTCAFAC